MSHETITPKDFMAPADAASALKDGNYMADTYEASGHVWFPIAIPQWRAVAAELARLQAKDLK